MCETTPYYSCTQRHLYWLQVAQEIYELGSIQRLRGITDAVVRATSCKLKWNLILNLTKRQSPPIQYASKKRS
ncbi:unnamed protein product [Stenotrophomonas maltophilia]|nr:unnamed protein product [Stenotrophomonas maltophilia]